MTKKQLKDYRPIKGELAALEALSRKIERHGSDELCRLYERKREGLTADLRHIEEVIEGLGPVERTLMRLRYIEGLEWHQVADRIHYSWQQTHRIHKQVLIKIKDL